MVLIVGGSYQGKTEYATSNFPNCRFFNQLHLFIKKRMDEGMGQEAILKEIHEAISEGDWVLIADELGNGVVPMDEKDIEWREVSGRILIELAKEAEEVHRVVLGIGQRIK
ncbi:adenosylcobinamide kinase /adenosylcobinamide-phosphate guanylyltransferase [Pseudobutyrivibrio ruminis]|uniref:Adenosylcobinamide kinase /adenosylcobinamide-phosphate guanylyltransferase n=1 Tax=Pseudobutyrivibrio ruminis TaxID=46206 RepID=A0A1H7GD47_9FIRM|nr:bifunctional adenosylcobinamide kinase/adenosylcobinamide-phosphate guanylyltransferase [Pseudobutyrivibrio ruminis]SEK36041.1 adenosylcobinamide kinase /adenosylcobinamide-phosphate guanylyltransferase [Pseudobutyrivibrio ruminis]